MASEKTSHQGSAHQFIDLLYKEPISSGTRRIGWFLIVASLMLIATIALDLKMRTMPMLPWDFSVSPDQFIMLALLAVGGLLSAFSLYALNDIFQKQEIDHHLIAKINLQIKTWLQSKANAIVDETFRPEAEDDQDDDPFYESVYAAVTAHLEKSEKTTKAQIEKIIYRTGPLRLRNLRFWIGICFPIILGIASLWVGGIYLLTLLKALAAVF